MDARVEAVLLPIARALIASDQIPFATHRAFFNDVLLHELCHAVGPVYVLGTDSVSVNEALKEHYTAIEEAKADIVGLHSIGVLIERGVLTRSDAKEHYVSALASFFRAVRFGTSEAHAKAAACALNFLKQKGAIRVDPVTAKWSVMFERFAPAVTSMAAELLAIQGRGDYDAAGAWLARWAVLPREVNDSLRRLDHIPVDIEPRYSIRWE